MTQTRVMFRALHKTLSRWRLAPEATAVSPTFRLSVGAHLAAITVGAVAATAYLTVYSASPQSLADYISAICAKAFGSAPAAEAPYLAENVSAMTKMMIDMGIRPSGDVDTDFVAMMVPHHQGAIEMAQAELRYGRNEPLRRMAQEIIVTQLQEITAMRLSLGQPLPPSVPSPDQIPPAAMSVAAIDTLKNEVIATSPIGQAPQALVYVPDAVPAASGTINSGNDQNDGRPRRPRNQQLAAARRGWPIGAAVARAAGSKERGESAHQRFAVGSGLGASIGGRGHWARAREAISACACD